MEAVDFSAAEVVASSFVDDYVPVTECRVLKYSISQDTPFVGVVVAGANVDAGLTLVWELAPGAGKLANTKVPAPPLNLFDTDAKLDIFDARIVAFQSNFLAGSIYVSDLELVDNLKSGRLDK